MTKQTLQTFTLGLLFAGFFFFLATPILLASDHQQNQTLPEAEKSYTVVLDGSNASEAPNTIQVGDTIVWQNNDTVAILLEQEVGYRVFLPLVQATNNANTDNVETSPSQVTTTSQATVASNQRIDVAAWTIEPGQSVAVRYKNANLYRIRVIADTISEWSMVVTN